MKKTFYIESIERHVGPNQWEYIPIPQNAKWFYNLWEKLQLECVGMKQWSDMRWEVKLKGKRANIQKFVADFSMNASKHYSLREYG